MREPGFGLGVMAAAKEAKVLMVQPLGRQVDGTNQTDVSLVLKSSKQLLQNAGSVLPILRS